MGNKIAFIFPGQGSQYPGMGKDFIDRYQSAREIIAKSGKAVNIDLKTLCTEGPEKELNNTKNTQPAIFTISMIIDKLLRKNGIIPSFVAGHSLGEYSALASAGVFDLKTGVKLVRKRGIIMD